MLELAVWVSHGGGEGGGRLSATFPSRGLTVSRTFTDTAYKLLLVSSTVLVNDSVSSFFFPGIFPHLLFSAILI